MTKIIRGSAVCNNCESEYTVDAYASVNTNLDPMLKEKILEDTLFKTICNKCGSTNYIAYDLLYHDMDNKTMIFLRLPTQDNSLDMEAFSDDTFGVMKEYKFFVARHPSHLMERIRTTDYGLDPRLIELYKFLWKSKHNLPLETPFEYLFFDTISSDTNPIIKFILLTEPRTSEILEDSLNDEMLQTAQRWIDLLEPKLEHKKWYLIDWQFPFGQIIGTEKYNLFYQSKITEFGDKNNVFPEQIIDVIKRTGKNSIRGKL